VRKLSIGGLALSLATLACWAIVAATVYVLVVLPQSHDVYACIGLDSSKVHWPGLTLVLVTILGVNVVAAFVRGGNGRFAQVMSLLVSLPLVWTWCEAIYLATRPCTV
jgi:hypothetical protein